jgi:DNA-binding MarR family transcriptional regulator
MLWLTTKKTRKTMGDSESMTSVSGKLNGQEPGKSWTFVTNHTQVLLAIARDRDIRLRDIARIVGITERAAQRIVKDLIEAGYVSRERLGRRNHYSVNHKAKMRHPSQREQDVGTLLSVLQQTG